DFYLWLDILPQPTHTWTVILILGLGIVVMGAGDGIYNASGIGSGPRDGFMLSISDMTNLSIGKVSMFVEKFVLVIGLLIGGPVFIFTFIFTFIQSLIFQFTYLKCRKILEHIHKRIDRENPRAV